AMAVLTAGFAPAEAVAKPKHVKKAIKRAHKQHRKAIKHHYKHHHRPIKIKYDYDWDDDYKNESWGIYTTPAGGLGFHYSENRGSYGYPYGYGYGYPGYGFYW